MEISQGSSRGHATKEWSRPPGAQKMTRTRHSPRRRGMYTTVYNLGRGAQGPRFDLGQCSAPRTKFVYKNMHYARGGVWPKWAKWISAESQHWTSKWQFYLMDAEYPLRQLRLDSVSSCWSVRLNLAAHLEKVRRLAVIGTGGPLYNFQDDISVPSVRHYSPLRWNNDGSGI